MGKLKIGIVGCGKIADCHHIPLFKECRGVEIAALCDVVPEQIEKRVKTHGLDKARHYHSFDDMIKSADIEAVVICTPNDLHYPMTIAALKHGWHVLCEKPMALNTKLCGEMIETAKKCNKVLQINQSWHFNPCGNKLRSLIAEGKIGILQHTSCVSCSTAPPHIAWSPGADWFVQNRHEGSLIQDIGVHLTEVTQWITGIEIIEAAAITSTFFPGIDVVDNFVSIVRFDNGASGTFELSWTSPKPRFTMEFTGSEGHLRMADGKLFYFKRGAKAEREIKVPALKLTSQRNFADMVRGKAVTHVTPGEVGREAIAICNAINESGASGKFVKVKKF